MRERRDAVLVVGFAAMSGGMATRLISLGYRPISVGDPVSAGLRIEREQEPVRAALVPASAPFLAPGALHGLAHAAGGSLRCIAIGPREGAADADTLRSAGVHATLVEPCSDRELRFALNRALYDDSRPHLRLHPRVATDLVARVRAGAREKAGLVYALSVAGCFLETDRPCVPGSLIAVHLPLPAGSVEAAARVASANVPGDFARPNLPRGMALEFLDLGAAQKSVIEAYIRERLAEQELVAAASEGRAPARTGFWASLRRLARPLAPARVAT